MIFPCLTLSIIRYVSRVKWSYPGEGVVPSPTPQCSSYWKGSLWFALNYNCQLYLLYTTAQTIYTLWEYLISYNSVNKLLVTNMGVGWKVHMMASNLFFMIFWPMGSKHSNTNGRSMWTTRGIMLKHKEYLVIFHESILVFLSTFWTTLIKKEQGKQCKNTKNMFIPTKHSKINEILALNNLQFPCSQLFVYQHLQSWRWNKGGQ